MNSLYILANYTFIDNLSWGDIEKILYRLPEAETKRVLSLKKEKDRIASVIGKLLLFYMLDTNNFSISYPKIQYTDTGRPYLQDRSCDFNISHSHNIVACAICTKSIVGIDVELIHKVDLFEYTSVLTKTEYLLLQNHDRKKEEFIKLWTIKEAVLKADGRGFYANINDLIVYTDFSKLENQLWYNHSSIIKEKYYLSIASSILKQPVIFEVNISDLWIEITNKL
jgi:4'-phosphopantetheinyl transferase